jgi:catechol 2,3-dioxygenase
VSALPRDAFLDRLSLRVRDLDAMLAYYVGRLGLVETGKDGNTITVAPEGELFHLDLVGEPDAPQRPYPCPGLYHFALVVPDRAALGAIFRSLIEQREPFEGMADHLVSEALYIRDPELNGIELYRDRPKVEWPHFPDGSLRMASDPIDADGILEESDTASTLDAGTRLGHIHMHVRNIADAERFYEHELGLNRTAAIPGALFYAAGDYHHHVGANTWAPSVPIPERATGLIDYTFRVPARHGSGWDGPDELTDPTGATVRFTAS